jgi:hypothetical protein
VLDTRRIRQRYGVEPPDLEWSLSACLAEVAGVD